jgi:hypothetical protein
VIHHIPQFIAVCCRSSPSLPSSPHDAVRHRSSPPPPLPPSSARSPPAPPPASPYPSPFVCSSNPRSSPKMDVSWIYSFIRSSSRRSLPVPAIAGRSRRIRCLPPPPARVRRVSRIMKAFSSVDLV